MRSFGKVLGIETCELPTLGILQEGLLNLGNSMGQVQDLLVRLLSCAVCDPGLPSGHRVRPPSHLVLLHTKSDLPNFYLA